MNYKLFTIVIMFSFCIMSLSACGSTGSSNSNPSNLVADNMSKDDSNKKGKYKIGDTVSTGLYEFTLKKADLTIACSNANDETFLLPKEYDPDSDKNNPFVAPIGTTMIGLQFEFKNLDRTGHSIGHRDADIPLTMKMTYDGKEYTLYRQYDASSTHQYELELDANYTLWDGRIDKRVTGRIIDPGQLTNIITYAVVPVNITDFESPFDLTLYLKDEKGKKVYFTYKIN